MLSVEQALERTIEESKKRAPLGRERVALVEAADRVLAESVVSPIDLPAHALSAMDGYALNWTESLKEGVELPVSGEARTGHPVPSLEPGSCMRIFTGARVPEGADTVLMQENVVRESGRVRVLRAPRRGDNVRLQGEDLRVGQLVLDAGIRLNPFHLSLLASVERSEVLVSRRPRVLILCTGDELRAPGSTFFGGHLAESNSVGLLAACRRAGADARRGPLVPDDRQVLEAELEQATRWADLVVTVGGVSVGDHDVVRPVLEGMGARIVFHKIALKPGKPTLLAELGPALVLGLPGNPTSAQVVFSFLGFPLIRALLNQSVVRPSWRSVRLRGDIRHKAGRVALLRGRLQGEEVQVLSNQGSGATTTIAWANALIRVPASCDGVSEGEPVDVLPWEAL